MKNPAARKEGVLAYKIYPTIVNTTRTGNAARAIKIAFAAFSLREAFLKFIRLHFPRDEKSQEKQYIGKNRKSKPCERLGIVQVDRGFKGYTVNLHCDVDLDNKLWVPIGLGARSNAAHVAFQGTFNGNGHTVYNLNGTKFYQAIRYGQYTPYDWDGVSQKPVGYYMHYENGSVSVDIPLHGKVDDNGDEFNFGLFGLSYNATFKNLTIENVQVDFTKKQLKTGVDQKPMVADSVGALVGFNLGALRVENCTAGSPDGNDSIKAYATAAGLVGRAYAGTSTNPAKENVIDGTVAPYAKIEFIDCKNYVDVTMSEEKCDKVGGIIGYPNRFGELLMRDCANYGAVTGGYAGGITGYIQGKSDMDSPVNIIDCVNYGTIVGVAAGGLFGQRDGGTSPAAFTINRFINYGEIKGKKVSLPSKKLYAGGLVGAFNLKSAFAALIDCYNYGNVSLTMETDTEAGYAGGLIGYTNITKNTAGKQGSIVLSGINMGDIEVKRLTNGKTTQVYGNGFVSIASTLEANAVYKQVYFFHSGTTKQFNGTEPDSTVATGHDNTNLTEYATQA